MPATVFSGTAADEAPTGGFLSWIWFLLWFVLSAFVLGAFAWSTRVLFQQKRAWGAFAKTARMTVTPGALLSSPQIQGVWDAFRFSLVSEEQKSPDARGTRFRSILELHRQIPMRFSGAVGFGDLEQQLGALNLPTTFIPQSPSWKPNWFLRTSDAAAMNDYLTEDRIKALESVFRVKAASALLVFDGMNVLLRLETPDALTDVRKLEAIVKRMTDSAHILFPLEAAAPLPASPAAPAPPPATSTPEQIPALSPTSDS